MKTENIYLEHAFVTVRNLKQSLAFYSLLFPGWKIRWEGDGERGGRWVHFGPEGEQPNYLSLYEFPAVKQTQDTPYETARLQHIGFAYPDVDGLIRRLESESIHTTEKKDDGKYRRAYFEDPDGHELEFVQKL